jgi:hypothetical protein
VVSTNIRNAQSDLTTGNGQRDPSVAVPVNGPEAIDPSSVRVSSRLDLGTKDAPVDGKDGKPHAGPFVDAEKDRKPPKQTEEGELILKKTPLPGAPADPTIIDGQPIPEVNDGVMNDPTRELPKQGTTGTEGGVSEKDKNRKALEGQTGEKVEMKPDSPKEAPPLPHSEEEKIQDHKEKDEKERKKSKGKDVDDDDVSEISGLEV